VLAVLVAAVPVVRVARVPMALQAPRVAQGLVRRPSRMKM